MHDALKCPRCMTTLPSASDGHDELTLDPRSWDIPNNIPRVYRCDCGPLCVVEGERVTWYMPIGAPLTTTATRAIVRRLFARYGFDADIAVLLGELERRPEEAPTDAR